MAPSTPKPKANHKVKKGETIEKIAKQYGFKDIHEIWRNDRNKDLVKKRKDPKAIQEGDIVVIPPFNDEEKAELKERKNTNYSAAGAEKYAAAAFADKAKLERETADKIDKAAAAHAAAADQFIQQFEQASKEAQQWSDGVDAASAVINLVRALKGMVAKSAEVSISIAEETAEAAAKKMDELVKMAKEFTVGPVTSEATKQAGKAMADPNKSSPLNELRLFIGALVESHGKMTSPSFWGQTVTLLAEGKNWSEAATLDFKGDAKTAIAQMKVEKARILKMSSAHSAACRNRAAWSDNAAKAAAKKQAEFIKAAEGG